MFQIRRMCFWNRLTIHKVIINVLHSFVVKNWYRAISTFWDYVSHGSATKFFFRNGEKCYIYYVDNSKSVKVWWNYCKQIDITFLKHSVHIIARKRRQNTPGPDHWHLAVILGLSLTQRCTRKVPQFYRSSFNNSMKLSLIGTMWVNSCGVVFTALHLCSAVLATSELSVRLSVTLSVCLSVKRVNCDIMKETCADILIPHEKAFIVVFCEEKWLVADDPFYLKFWVKLTQ